MENKRAKARPAEKSWFDLFLEVRSDCESRCFKLEEKICELEERLLKLENNPRNIVLGSSIDPGFYI